MISRSKARTGDGLYRTEKAHSYATAKRRKCRRGFHFSEAVFRGVDAAIRLRWSHEQIVGEFIKEGKPAASQETIYRRIRRDERRSGSLYRCTRIMSRTGRERYRSRPARGIPRGKRHTRARPACACASGTG